MTQILLIALATLCLLIFVRSFRRPSRIVELPFFYALVFLGWVLPQLLGALTVTSLPRGALDKTIIMAILCMSSLCLGYALNNRRASLFNWTCSYNKLILCSYVLATIGALASFQVSRLAPAMGRELWTGPITIYVFFEQFLSFALCISLLLFLDKKTIPSIALVLFTLSFYIDRIFVHGRRSDLSELILIFLMALWFKRSWIPPRVVIIIAFVFGVLFINAIGAYRSLMVVDAGWSGASFGDILQIDFIGILQDIASGSTSDSELLNAAFDIHATDRTMVLNYGVTQWNGLVFRFVPAQLIGADIKQLLTIPVPDPAYDLLRYEPLTGSTSTGLSDSFRSFWYFGSINFFLIGYITSRWYLAARQGAFPAQVIVALSITKALHGITHSTDVYYSFMFQLLLCLVPALWLCRASLHEPDG